MLEILSQLIGTARETRRITVSRAAHYRLRATEPGSAAHGQFMGGMCMRFVRSWLLVAVALLAVARGATAQTTNGTLSGHVADQQGLALPGVTVNATSPSLQGVRSVVTSDNGDYAMVGLPAGEYTLSFDLSGFERVTKTVTLSPTQTLPVDAQMGIAGANGNRQRRRPHGRHADEHVAGRDQLQAGLHPDAADEPRHQRHHADRAGGAPDGPERELLDRGRDVVRNAAI